MTELSHMLQDMGTIMFTSQIAKTLYDESGVVPMPIDGYVEYQRREYCKDIRCPRQLELETKAVDSDEYQAIRQKCQTACLHTTYEFHHWLIGKGYLIVRPAE